MAARELRGPIAAKKRHRADTMNGSPRREYGWSRMRSAHVTRPSADAMRRIRAIVPVALPRARSLMPAAAFLASRE